eukprot:6178077-Amphidinium_carterae.1
MLHAGTIPESASRMSFLRIVVSLGQGLTGLLPSIPGTVSLLSIWENSLQGRLPELHLLKKSTLLVYDNAFSCKLPRHYDVESNCTASLALIGNRFAQPRHAPSWIMPAELPTD